MHGSVVLYGCSGRNLHDRDTLIEQPITVIKQLQSRCSSGSIVLAVKLQIGIIAVHDQHHACIWMICNDLKNDTEGI